MQTTSKYEYPVPVAKVASNSGSLIDAESSVDKTQAFDIGSKVNDRQKYLKIKINVILINLDLFKINNFFTCRLLDIDVDILQSSC